MILLTEPTSSVMTSHKSINEVDEGFEADEN